MNYKIKITAENHTIVKRIADENGMNPNRFHLMFIRRYYTIENGIFERYITSSDFQELTTEQFIEMFDKQNKNYNYSKEDLKLAFEAGQSNNFSFYFDIWFQQFKKI